MIFVAAASGSAALNQTYLMSKRENWYWIESRKLGWRSHAGPQAAIWIRSTEWLRGQSPKYGDRLVWTISARHANIAYQEAVRFFEQRLQEVTSKGDQELEECLHNLKVLLLGMRLELAR